MRSGSFPIFRQLLPAAALAGILGLPAAGARAAAPTYARDIRPILKDRCVVCHNRSALSDPSISGGLALDSYAAIRTGVVGKAAHPVLAAGHSAESDLIKRLSTTSPTTMMPRGGPPLPAAQIALFRRWIDAVAPAGAGAETTAPAPAAPAPMPSDP